MCVDGGVAYPVLLEPGNTKVLGGAVEDMDAEQAGLFVQHLQDRLEWVGRSVLADF